MENIVKMIVKKYGSYREKEIMNHSHTIERAGTWNAQIYCNGKYINLGTYKAKEDAIKARKEAEEKYFGEFTHKN